MASERIRLALMEARRRNLPVVASMGSVATSGGYWVATSAETIYAQPSTLTGSIGVFAIIPTFSETLENAGIGADGGRYSQEERRVGEECVSRCQSRWVA